MSIFYTKQQPNPYIVVKMINYILRILCKFKFVTLLECARLLLLAKLICNSSNEKKIDERILTVFSRGTFS